MSAFGDSFAHQALRRLCVAVLLSLPALTAAAAEIPLAERRSGHDFMSRETRAMQDDDMANPGVLWVLDGETLWNARAGAAGRACADCHGDARESMKGVAARYPAYDAARARPLNLQQRIDLCRTERQKAPPLAPEGKDALALGAYVARQARGLPIAVEIDGRNRPFFEAGREAFHRRQGQLNLSCAQCHDDNWNKRLAGNAITQAHPNGYPLYRLEWQGMGSLQRRLRNCMVGVRAQTYDYNDADAVNLELFLMGRARGMKMEAPAVRP